MRNQICRVSHVAVPRETIFNALVPIEVRLCAIVSSAISWLSLAKETNVLLLWPMNEKPNLIVNAYNASLDEAKALPFSSLDFDVGVVSILYEGFGPALTAWVAVASYRTLQMLPLQYSATEWLETSFETGE